MSIAQYLNQLSEKEAQEALLRCCGSSQWVQHMCSRRPFADDEQVHEQADQIWKRLTKPDFLEAFSHHPQIGASKESLREKFHSTHQWSANEQAGMSQADEDILERLVQGNKAYLERFGYIFIVCATGKTAAEMCVLLEQRLPNDPEEEINIAAGEQAKITHIRLEKLLS